MHPDPTIPSIIIGYIVGAVIAGAIASQGFGYDVQRAFGAACFWPLVLLRHALIGGWRAIR